MLNSRNIWIETANKQQHYQLEAQSQYLLKLSQTNHSEAKGRNIMERFRLILVMGVVSLLAACSTGAVAKAPHSIGSLPTELVGGWYNGSVSSVNFYDSGTGHWGSPSGEGLFYTFSSDGNFTNGFMNQTNLYGCTTFFMIWLEGSVEIQGSSMKLHNTKGQKKFEAPCASSLNEDRPLTAQELDGYQSQFVWNLVQDESNPSQTDLVMTLPDGNPWATFAPHSGF